MASRSGAAFQTGNMAALAARIMSTVGAGCVRNGAEGTGNRSGSCGDRSRPAGKLEYPFVHASIREPVAQGAKLLAAKVDAVRCGELDDVDGILQRPRVA